MYIPAIIRNDRRGISFLQFAATIFYNYSTKSWLFVIMDGMLELFCGTMLRRKFYGVCVELAIDSWPSDRILVEVSTEVLCPWKSKVVEVNKLLYL